jgi:hypothetical protein
MPNSLIGVAIVGKKNKPLLVLGEPEQLVGLNFTVHSCLDLVDERCGVPLAQPYLGLLGLSGAHATYAMFAGATNLKIFAVMDADSEPAPKDEQVKGLLQALHACYVDWACNPFVKLDKRGLAVVDDPVPLDGGPGVDVLRARIGRLMQMVN